MKSWRGGEGRGGEGGGGNLSMVLHPTQGGVATLLVASCHGDRDKFRLGELIGSNICLTFFFFYLSITR